MTQVSEVCTPKSDKKKFFIKRKCMREEQPEKNSSIFKITSLGEMNMGNQDLFDQLKSLKTVNSDLDSSVVSYHTINSTRVKPTAATQFPKISLKSKNLQQTGSTALQSAQITGNSEDLNRLIPKPKLSFHECDPLHIRNQVDAEARILKKYAKYKRNWMDKFIAKRKGKSLIQKSLQKAQKNIENINKDAILRKNTTDLNQMLRDNISSKTFIYPAQFKSQLKGLKGKGGKSIPIFQEIFLVEEIYKFDK